MIAVSITLTSTLISLFKRHRNLALENLALRQQPELGVVIEIAEVGGLHHRYERRAA
jgi:hypothetical protein